MKEQIRTHKGFKIYLTPQDQSLADPDIWSWQGSVFHPEYDYCIYSHYFTMDDVLWGNYTVDYMFQRVVFDLDRIIEMEDL